MVCPGFVSDCLETLEEIGIEVQQRVPEGRRQEFHAIPCLNEHPAWIAALVDIVARATWRAGSPPPPDAAAREATLLRAKAHGSEGAGTRGAAPELAPAIRNLLEPGGVDRLSNWTRSAKSGASGAERPTRRPSARSPRISAEGD